MLILYSMQKAGHYWGWCLREDQFTECIHAWLFSNSNLFDFQHYVPTVFENYVTDCRVDGRSVQLALWDTAGQEDYERLRPLAYSKAHVILIGFAVDTPDSLENVKHKFPLQWIEEANERCPGVPIILVGLKKDLREDPLAIEEMRKKSLRFVTSREGSETATQIGARKYLECSSLTGEGVDDVFEAATRAALLTFDKRKSSCCIVL
ncbi:Rho GTPase [Aspergillus turcosus]|uniref:Rho GTPase n=1 Tax=Aspergillus turcosus TaxID=1245748 RepID=A0A397IFA0_9EURO|nr:Rho GTPase [Aspergillus turcosus]RLL98002.1 Rho GTPase [Aspergillus turcosus]